MNIAIIYGSKHGSTKKVAELISKGLGGNNVSLFNLTNHRNIDFALFDTIIIGGPVYAGKLNKRVKMFLKKHTADLIQKRIAFFMCAMNQPEFEKQFTREFPKLLRDSAFSAQFVGGEMIFEKMNFIERLITRKITGIKYSTSKINHTAINQLIYDIISVR